MRGLAVLSTCDDSRLRSTEDFGAAVQGGAVEVNPNPAETTLAPAGGRAVPGRNRRSFMM